MWCCALHTRPSRTCATPHRSLLPHISPFLAGRSSTFNWALAQVLVPEARQNFYRPTEWSLGCRRPGRARVARRWFLGYSRHGRPGSCKPTGCLGSSGCNPCSPTAHWTFCLQRTCTAMTTPANTIGLGQHQRHSPPPIDQTTVNQKHQLGTGVQFAM